MKKHEVSNSRVYLRDCMEAMAEFTDNYFDLAVVDPPYGLGVNKMKMGGRKTVAPSNKKWDDCVPNDKYFTELFRVSKNQVIWGGNYFNLPANQYFAIWDKGETMYGRDFAEAEYAWIRNGGTRIYKKSPNQLDRFHPTQKPVALYDWIFAKYATPGMKILDTHLGSGSSRISAQKAGMDFWGYEIDEEYFTAHCKRFDIFYSQGRLF